VGLAGLVGSGRTEILRMIFGADPREKGDVILNGRKVNIKNPTQAIAHGIGLIPEDRKSQGVLLYFGIDWNITMSVLKKNSKKGFLQFQKLKEIAEKYSGRLRVKTPSLQQKVVNLSGGNQQKVVLAKTLAADCDVILFDEPTRGIDVGAKAEIYNLMTELADEGKAILMVSSDMEELLGMSDRIYVLCEGRMNGEVMGKDATQIRLMHLMSGEKE
jgi:ribose transport system ATP-binding protein